MNKKLMIIMALMAFTTLTYNLAHPVTPQLIAEQNQGPAFLGLIFAAMAFANFAFSPLWGGLSDRFGRKPIMLIAPIGYGIAQLGFGYSMEPIPIIFFRLLAGTMASASFIGGMAYIVDVTKKEERSKHLAFYTALTGFTGTLGYLLGGLVGNKDYHIAFIFQASFSFLLGLLIFLFLKEPAHARVRRQKTGEKGNREWSIILPYLLVIVFLTGIVYKGFDISFNSYLKFTLDATPLVIGIAMAVSGLVGLLTNFGIYPLLKRYASDLNLLIGTILLMAIASFLFTLDSSPTFFISLMVIFFACLNLYKPLLQAIISKLGKRHGEIMGWNNAANSIGLVIGSLVVGALYEEKASYAFFAICGISLLASLLLLLRHRSIKPYGLEEYNEKRNS